MMGPCPLQRLQASVRRAAGTVRSRLADATWPSALVLVGGALADAARSRPALIAKNALLRQQLLILRRGRPGRLPHPG